MLNEVGKKVTTSVENYFNEMGQFETLKNYEWEYILIDEPETLNAWCMPGGKIAILPPGIHQALRVSGSSIRMYSHS